VLSVKNGGLVTATQYITQQVCYNMNIHMNINQPESMLKFVHHATDDRTNEIQYVSNSYLSNVCDN
jgi:hypothetical protein